MKRLFLILALLCAAIPAQAQRTNIIGGGIFGDGKKVGSYVGPGDVVAGATAWSGWRAYKKTYIGSKAVNICDSATGAVCSDVNIAASGYVDAATVAALTQCSVACEVAVRYDQTGNGHDWSVAHGNRPTVLFNAINSYVCNSYTTASTQRLGATMVIGAPYTYIGIAQRSALFTTAQGLWYGTVATPASAGRIFFTTSTNTASYNGYESSTPAITITLADSTWHAIQLAGKGPIRDTEYSYVDGSLTTQAITGATADNFSALTIGAAYNGTTYSSYLSGADCEMGVYSGTDFNAGGNFAAMNTNMHAAYGGF